MRRDLQAAESFNPHGEERRLRRVSNHEARNAPTHLDSGLALRALE
jgi:hypothetical protein